MIKIMVQDRYGRWNEYARTQLAAIARKIKAMLVKDGISEDKIDLVVE